MTTHKLYGGEVELVFDEARHRYTANGVPCQGVTSALSVINKPALMPWAVKQGAEFARQFIEALPFTDYNEYLISHSALVTLLAGIKSAHRNFTSDAADVGKIAHKFAEDFVAGRKPFMPVNAQAKAACEAFCGWWDANHVLPLHSERVVYSRLHHYAGTVDFTATINGRLFIADFKTSSGLYDEMRFQVAAYKLALVEEGVEPSDAGRMILRFAKDGSGFHVHELPASEDERDREAFLCALRLSSIINQAKAAQKEAA